MTSGLTTTGSIPGTYYRKRQWNGGNNGPGENSYTYSINDAVLIPVKYKRTAAATHWYSGSMNTFKPSYSLVQGAPNDVLNKATLRVWEDLSQSKFNAGVFSGEFRETYRMSCDIVMGIAKAIRAAKRGRWDKAFRYLSLSKTGSLTGTAANSYMMVHFGILPLLNDLEALYELMKSSYKVVKRIRKSSKLEEETSKSSLGVVWRNKYCCAATIRGSVEMIELNEFDRLGVSNAADLAVTAWELTRLSWLVDWVFPIGNFLSAISASNKTRGGDFWVSRMEYVTTDTPVNEGSYKIEPFDKHAYQTYYLPGPQNSRSHMSSLPWSFPTIKNPLGDNLSRWTTATALLRQSVGR